MEAFMDPWYRSHVLSTRDWQPEKLGALFQRATTYKKAVAERTGTALTDAHSMMTLFYEPSTRTRLSFEAAALRLGIGVLTVADAGTSSSAFKGETLEDTARIVSAYADLIILRHPAVGSAARFANMSGVPVINAGDGAGEHPTQSLVDLFTINEVFPDMKGLRVGLCGDLRHGRTIHSLLRLLQMFQCDVVAISPEELGLPPEEATGVRVESELLKALPDLDVLYMTRVQKERFASAEAYQRVAHSYELGPTEMSRAKQGMIVMHPLPRMTEISPDVDADRRAAYFTQAANGVPVRMALLSLILRGA
jgi:aspartate carbamoyltransferase catalytic subunit